MQSGGKIMILQFESLTIIAIVFIFVVAFTKKGRYEYAISISSLAVEPFAYLFLDPVANWLAEQMGVRLQMIQIVILLGCLLVATIILVICSGWIANKKARLIFLGTTVMFIFILTCIYISNIL